LRQFAIYAGNRTHLDSLIKVATGAFLGDARIREGQESTQEYSSQQGLMRHGPMIAQSNCRASCM
jgi:hypothetical protein